MNITIGYLYGDLMNIYGDTGNIVTLQKRCEWRGIEVEVKNISVGDKLKKGDCDIYFFGGGQDQAQSLISKDLIGGSKDQVKRDVERGVPLLAICGGYQLLGTYYKPQNGPKLSGLGIFPVFTKASRERMIGNIVVKLTANSLPSTTKIAEDGNLPAGKAGQKTENLLVGFENHSGKTYLKDGAQALGKVMKGFGNNGEDQTEGCIHKNAIGCYMHGSLLPKNPKLADWLIKTALEVKYGEKIELGGLDDSLEIEAHNFAVQKFS